MKSLDERRRNLNGNVTWCKDRLGIGCIQKLLDRLNETGITKHRESSYFGYNYAYGEFLALDLYQFMGDKSFRDAWKEISPCLRRAMNCCRKKRSARRFSAAFQRIRSRSSWKSTSAGTAVSVQPPLAPLMVMIINRYLASLRLIRVFSSGWQRAPTRLHRSAGAYPPHPSSVPLVAFGGCRRRF